MSSIRQPWYDPRPRDRFSFKTQKGDTIEFRVLSVEPVTEDWNSQRTVEFETQQNGGPVQQSEMPFGNFVNWTGFKNPLCIELEGTPVAQESTERDIFVDPWPGDSFRVYGNHPSLVAVSVSIVIDVHESTVRVLEADDQPGSAQILWKSRSEWANVPGVADMLSFTIQVIGRGVKP